MLIQTSTDVIAPHTAETQQPSTACELLDGLPVEEMVGHKRRRRLEKGAWTTLCNEQVLEFLAEFLSCFLFERMYIPLKINCQTVLDVDKW